MRTKLGLARLYLKIFMRQPYLGVHVWMSGNPYSELLYREFRDSCSPQPLTQLEELDAFTRLPASRRLLWIHSEASYSWGRSGEGLEKAYRSYINSLERWSRKKGRLVWTIHDEGLHLNDPDPSRIERIRNRLRDLADYVHVHSEAAKIAAVERFGIEDARVIVAAHPSYATLYENSRPRRKSESDGEERGSRRLLCFGYLKAYKNYDALAAALEALGPGSFARLTIAGTPPGEGIVLPEESYRRNVDLDLQLRFIPDREVPQLFADAHFLVLPYADSLTSGAAALSMGFGMPVIAPDLGGMREAVPEGNWSLLYDAADADGLAEALRRARDMPPTRYDTLCEECRVFGDASHPNRISSYLLTALRERGILVA